MEVHKNVREYALVGFLLLSVLFGMNLMAFIFGNLNTSATASINDVGVTVTNLTGAWVNQSGYTIPEASYSNYSHSFTVLQIYNNTDGVLIPASNYTIDQNLGTITNATKTIYNNANITYTINEKTEAKLTTEAIGNRSVASISTYSGNASTQMNILSITIGLVLLLGIFGLFWAMFMGGKSKQGGSAGTFE